MTEPRLYAPDLENLRRELLRFRFDAQYRSRATRVTMQGVADMAQVDRQTLYAIMRRHQMFALRADTMARITEVVAMVVDRGLRWRRTGRHWQPYMIDGSKVRVPGSYEAPANRELRHAADPHA